MKLILGVLVVFSSLMANAENAELSAKNCDGSTAEMVGCLILKAEKSQLDIDAATTQLKAILDDSKKFGDGEPADYDAAKVKLDTANKNYAAFIASQCEVEGNLETMTGTLASIVRADCVAKLTKTRADYLKELVKSYN